MSKGYLTAMAIRQEKERKGIQIGKEGVSVTTCRWYEIIHRKS